MKVIYSEMYTKHNQVCTCISEIFLIVEVDDLHG